MHVPDGFLNAPTSVATATAAAAVVGVALRRSRNELGDRAAPLAGLTAAFVFAVQMLNFPVGVGTSGHLMGGALVATLVGPWTGMLCVSVVLIVQALLFADGGLTALGTNIILIGVVTVAVSWAVIRLTLALRPQRSSVVPAAAIGAFLSVPAAAMVFVVLFAVGGEAGLPLGTLTAGMLGWHAAIGVGEAVITALTVSAVAAARPDLVHAFRGRALPSALVRPDGSPIAAPVAVERRPTARARKDARILTICGGVLALLLAGVVSFFASNSPDGLEYVAEQRGFLETAREHMLGGSVLADYGEVGGIPVGLAGTLGVVATVGLAWLTFRTLARRRTHERTGP